MKNYRLTLSPDWVAEVEAENEEDAIEELSSTIAMNNEVPSNLFFENIVVTEVKELRPLDEEIDVDFMMEFRQKYWDQWEAFCHEKGYKANINEEE